MPGGASFSPASVAAFILFVGILIFVHELGHFLAAKYFGIKVLKFSLGFGPTIFRFTRGETTYQIALLPLGGYVKMLGDSPLDEIAPEDRARAFTTVPVYQRAVVAFAGPAFNLIFPVMCFFAYYLLGPTVDAPVVGQVEVQSPAEGAGLRPGDRIVEIEGSRVWEFEQISELVRQRAGLSTKITIARGEERIPLEVTPREGLGRDEFGAPETRGMIGISASQLSAQIGVDTRLGHELGFQTGDRILKIADRRIERLPELEESIRAHAGQTVPVVLARPETRAAGELLLLTRENVLTISVAIPARAEGVAALGLGPASTFVRSLRPDGAAARAGLRPGDRIVAVAGKPTSFIISLIEAVDRAQGKAVAIEISRLGERRTVEIAGSPVATTNPATGKDEETFEAGLGLGPVTEGWRSFSWFSSARRVRETVHLSIGEALVASVVGTGKVIAGISFALYKLFTGDISVKTVGGPILLFQVAAQAAEVGLFAYLQWLAVISVNLGLINLLPVPVLDGGHLMFCAIEAIKRRPVSLRVRELATIVGLVLLAVLIVLVFSNDISRLSGGVR
ncbi:MAG: RIP metalloprotease RseP [Deltaproteobacteria bacterium]|nr:RIP metalloprotease RseP [Deltaproteobacteria bacterium]